MPFTYASKPIESVALRRLLELQERWGMQTRMAPKGLSLNAVICMLMDLEQMLRSCREQGRTPPVYNTPLLEALARHYPRKGRKKKLKPHYTMKNTYKETERQLRATEEAKSPKGKDYEAPPDEWWKEVE